MPATQVLEPSSLPATWIWNGIRSTAETRTQTQALLDGVWVTQPVSYFSQNLFWFFFPEKQSYREEGWREEGSKRERARSQEPGASSVSPTLVQGPKDLSCPLPLLILLSNGFCHKTWFQHYLMLVSGNDVISSVWSRQLSLPENK